jgi:hypothetical protein
MNYPQAYIFLEPSAPSFPPDDWRRRASADVYLEGVSSADAELDKRILDFKCVYAFLNPKSQVHPVNVLVCNTHQIGNLLAWTIAGSVKAIYWISSREHLQDIEHVRNCLDMHLDLILALAQVSRIYSDLQNHERRTRELHPIDDARISGLASILEPETLAPAIRDLRAYVINTTREGLLNGQDGVKGQPVAKAA